MGASLADDQRRELPPRAALDEAGNVLIKDKTGKEVAFKSLYTDRPAEEQQLIIFIRHFFCGSCEQYVKALARDLSPSTLSAANTTLTIIGDGDHILISDYAKRTGCPFEIYTDSSVQIHKTLGMVSTLKYAAQAPGYAQKSFMKNVVDSAWTALTSGHPLSSGPSAQNGGEYLFQGGELKWCSRMRNTADHTETQELKQVIGIKE
ncbi:Putative peroxiredoxin-like 2A/B/C, Thioredoxin-like superfamily [Septoria linicola]|uniref:Peroxiredoxin-like 2A/B/C, Thioredoxin-like superfamily n=1 Tax=Septoria linicola TaxID=215465 RepID=A0A9Q9ACV8_9PEZI|nr:putative peroxiredoxin-like 2A/B/C, Thioredoxin-like superfamily [Septoria linicola]USW46790.1 Putative peroxiredoxin-like 2A/B/C, Thioredoxin-like superfamily [Septoria linicola]